jgi:type 1 glutamine amidotransferase
LTKRPLELETLETRTLLSSVLVFSKTAGFRHDSIPDGVAAIRQMGQENGFQVDTTEDSGAFTDDNLSQYQAVVFLLTTGTVLDENQKAAFERFIEAGNGYVGVHSAADTEYDWAWYGQLMGAYFSNHPNIQPAEVDVEDHDHPSTQGLPDVWPRTDEWYNYRINPRGNVNVLATLDESTYSGGQMGSDHPIMWYHNFDGGRAWYTGMGHTSESYSEPLFLQSLLGGIEYAMGSGGGSGSSLPHRPLPTKKPATATSARGKTGHADSLPAVESHHDHAFLTTRLTADALVPAPSAGDLLPSEHRSHVLAGILGFNAQGHLVVDGSAVHPSSSVNGPIHTMEPVPLPGWHKPG